MAPLATVKLVAVSTTAAKLNGAAMAPVTLFNKPFKPPTFFGLPFSSTLPINASLTASTVLQRLASSSSLTPPASFQTFIPFPNAAKPAPIATVEAPAASIAGDISPSPANSTPSFPIWLLAVFSCFSS